MDDQSQNQAEHAAASPPSAPINQGESAADKIARIRREAQERNSGQSASPTSGTAEVKENTSTTAGSATQDRTDPQRVGTAPSRTIAGQPTGRVSDGSLSGERVRVAPTGVVPESNDVMLGDQSSRKDGPKDGSLKADGSSSPHDSTSDGGSRQQAGHQQTEALKASADAAKENPAFQAEAKARTI